MAVVVRLAISGVSKPPSPGDHSAARPGNGGARPSTVLVVEDEVLVRMPIAEHLRESGFRVIEASNATEAQDIFRAREPIEVVFSDITMPGPMNGADLARWVRQNFPDVKIILTSGARLTLVSPEPDPVEDLFLPKPYQYGAIIEHIRRLLRS
jgi:CheY-like chemotaxis protein